MEFLVEMIYQVSIFYEFLQIMILLFVVVITPIRIHHQDWSTTL